jgi:hypothetical protein
MGWREVKGSELNIVWDCIGMDLGLSAVTGFLGLGLGVYTKKGLYQWSGKVKTGLVV